MVRSSLAALCVLILGGSWAAAQVHIAPSELLVQAGRRRLLKVDLPDLPKGAPVCHWHLREGRAGGRLQVSAGGRAALYTAPREIQGSLAVFHVQVRDAGDDANVAEATIRVIPDYGLPDFVVDPLLARAAGPEFTAGAPMLHVLFNTTDFLGVRAGAAPEGSEQFRSFRYLEGEDLPAAFDHRLLVATGHGLYTLLPYAPTREPSTLVPVPGARDYKPLLVTTAPANSDPNNPYLAAFVGTDPQDATQAERIYTLSRQDGSIHPLAGGPNPNAGIQNPSVAGTGTEARFSKLMDLAMDRVGNVYASDPSALWRVAADTGQVTLVAGKPGDPELADADGLGEAARFGLLMKLALDPATGDIYGMQAFNLIRRITPRGEVTTVLGNLKGGPPPKVEPPIGYKPMVQTPFRMVNYTDFAVLGRHLVFCEAQMAAIIAYDLDRHHLQAIVANGLPAGFVEKGPAPGPLHHFAPEDPRPGGELGRSPFILAASQLGTCFVAVAGPWDQSGISWESTLVTLDLSPLLAPAAAPPLRRDADDEKQPPAGAAAASK